AGPANRPQSWSASIIQSPIRGKLCHDLGTSAAMTNETNSRGTTLHRAAQCRSAIWEGPAADWRGEGPGVRGGGGPPPPPPPPLAPPPPPPPPGRCGGSGTGRSGCCLG